MTNKLDSLGTFVYPNFSIPSTGSKPVNFEALHGSDFNHTWRGCPPTAGQADGQKCRYAPSHSPPCPCPPAPPPPHQTTAITALPQCFRFGHYKRRIHHTFRCAFLSRQDELFHPHQNIGGHRTSAAEAQTGAIQMQPQSPEIYSQVLRELCRCSFCSTKCFWHSC